MGGGQHPQRQLQVLLSGGSEGDQKGGKKSLYEIPVNETVCWCNHSALSVCTCTCSITCVVEKIGATILYNGCFEEHRNTCRVICFQRYENYQQQCHWSNFTTMVYTINYTHSILLQCCAVTTAYLDPSLAEALL